MTGAPAIRVPIARRALAVTTALSGSGPASRRRFPAAIPALVVTVSAASGARAVSLVTSATFAPGHPPGYTVSADAAGRPERSTGPAAVVSWSRTVRESESESGLAARLTLSRVAPGANRVSAAASTRIAIGLLGRGPTLAWMRAGVALG